MPKFKLNIDRLYHNPKTAQSETYKAGDIVELSAEDAKAWESYGHGEIVRHEQKAEQKEEKKAEPKVEVKVDVKKIDTKAAPKKGKKK